MRQGGWANARLTNGENSNTLCCDPGCFLNQPHQIGAVSLVRQRRAKRGEGIVLNVNSNHSGEAVLLCKLQTVCPLLIDERPQFRADVFGLTHIDFRFHWLQIKHILFQLPMVGGTAFNNVQIILNTLHCIANVLIVVVNCKNIEWNLFVF